MLRALPQYQAYTILEQKIINFKHVVARVARLDSCQAFSQKGQEFTQPHSNTADVLRVCAFGLQMQHKSWDEGEYMHVKCSAHEHHLFSQQALKLPACTNFTCTAAKRF